MAESKRHGGESGWTHPHGRATARRMDAIQRDLRSAAGRLVRLRRSKDNICTAIGLRSAALLDSTQGGQFRRQPALGDERSVGTTGWTPLAFFFWALRAISRAA